MDDPATTTDAPADFGAYQLLARLARGGMAELYRARHRVTGADVVLKRLLPELEARPDVVDSFLTEADVGRLLHHENIVNVVDAGEHEGRYFLVMEYVDGLDVHGILRHVVTTGEPLPLELAMRIAVDALRGLHHAHELISPQGRPFGLVHRDVSPDNLFVDRNGVTKVADFGIAKLATFEAGTLVGVIRGKLAYMSPDQVRGLKLDGRADAFALALIVYEMVSGVRPLAPREGEGELATLARIAAPRIAGLHRVEPTCPRGIARVVDRALRAWRWRRHPSCGAFADALEQAAEKEDLLAPRARLAAHVHRIRGPA